MVHVHSSHGTLADPQAAGAEKQTLLRSKRLKLAALGGVPIISNNSFNFLSEISSMAEKAADLRSSGRLAAALAVLAVLAIVHGPMALRAGGSALSA
jgi:hypothetical protein